MKSSLKTFLVSKKLYGNFCTLKGCKTLGSVCPEEIGESIFWINNDLWCVDVLDDGTAITYAYKD